MTKTRRWARGGAWASLWMGRLGGPAEVRRCQAPGRDSIRARVSSETRPSARESAAAPIPAAADATAGAPRAGGWLGRTLTPRRRKSLGVLLRFGLSSAGTMAVKVALTWLFAHRLEEHLSYFLTHVLIFFWSYYSHLRFTFDEPHSGRRMWDYFKAVLLLKIADFVLFSLILKVSENELSLSVLIASLVMTSGRFVTVRRALVRREAGPADPDRTQ